VSGFYTLPKVPGGCQGSPVKNSARRVSDGEPADLLKPADYPLTAECSGCHGTIRLGQLRQMEWTHGARAARVLREYAAKQLAAELRCKVAPAPLRPGRVEASGRGWLLIGTPEEVRAEVLRMQEQERRQRERRTQLLEWLDVLGTLGRPS
jgi:hypothetical protein